MGQIDGKTRRSFRSGTTKFFEPSSWNFIALSYDYVTGVQRVWSDGKVYDAANVGQFGLKTQEVIRMGVKDGDPRFLKGRI